MGRVLVSQIGEMPPVPFPDLTGVTAYGQVESSGVFTTPDHFGYGCIGWSRAHPFVGSCHEWGMSFTFGRGASYPTGRPWKRNP